MRKEIFIAILIGLVMGLFITYGFYHSQRTTDSNQVTNIIDDLVNDDSTPSENGKLTLFSPENEIVQTERKTKVTGSATANSTIVIYVNNDPIITQADETGNFSKEVELDPLANIITVYSIDSSGEINSATRSLVVYDQELKLKDQENGESLEEESVEE